MKLDRNTNKYGRGKYALIKLRTPGVFRRATNPNFTEVEDAAIDFGTTPDTDFFVMRFKDKFAGPALRGYASAITAFIGSLDMDNPARVELTEYHHEIIALAEKATAHPSQRIPD